MDRNPDQSAELLAFVVELGAAMNTAGQPVYVVQERLTKVASVYGARGRDDQRVPDLPHGDDGSRRTGDDRVDDCAHRLAQAGPGRFAGPVVAAGRTRWDVTGRRAAPARGDPRLAAAVRESAGCRGLRRAGDGDLFGPPSGAARGRRCGGLRWGRRDPAHAGSGSTNAAADDTRDRRVRGVGTERAWRSRKRSPTSGCDPWWPHSSSSCRAQP